MLAPCIPKNTYINLNILGLYGDILRRWFRWILFRSHVIRGKFSGEGNVGKGESNGTAHCQEGTRTLGTGPIR